VVPWQPWFFGRKGDPAKGFDYTYHMFWGLEDVIANFTNGWNSVKTNKKVGGLFPNDGDGNAWGDKELGFPKPLASMGYSLTDPGRFQNGTQDFSAQIAAFKREGVEIVTGVVIPPDAKTFLTQARQQGFKPKVITLGKALLFPGAIEALGDLGDGLTTEGLVEPVASVRIVADQAEREGARRCLRERCEEAVDPADRLRARAVRGRGRCAEAQQEHIGEGRARRRRGHQPGDRRRPGQVGRTRSVQECQQDTARARPMGQGHQVQDGADDRQRRGREEHPDRRHAPADVTERAGTTSKACRCRCSRSSRSASRTARSRSPTTSRSR
jgi:hypothetical protein